MHHSFGDLPNTTQIISMQSPYNNVYYIKKNMKFLIILKSFFVIFESMQKCELSK